MKKIICLAAALLLLALALTGCHKHVSAAPATCYRAGDLHRVRQGDD